MRGIPRARFEELVKQYDYTVHEYQLNIYYSSLDRHYLETFLNVMDGEQVKVCYNVWTIEHRVTEEYVIRTLEELKRGVSNDNE